MAKAFVRILMICVVLFIVSESSGHPTNNKKTQDAIEFIVLHNNDMHARFEQTNLNGEKCLPEDVNTQKCYGGFARVAHEVRKYRKDAQSGGIPVLFLNAGDTYTGTTWFTVFKHKITTEFLNKLNPDAISLGNHEFDEKIEGLLPFLNNAQFPVLTCNIDATLVPEMTQAKSFMNSTVLQVKDVRVGVIGYLTTDTQFLVSPKTVEFKPEIACINEEAAKMKAAGINIIIALGHSGYRKDQEIAARCPDVDVVIGGHTHTFLYTGPQPDAERSEGPYPTVVKQKSGKKVPVVQAYAYTKYLGKLHLKFDKNGNLIEFDGSPILLNAAVPRDDEIVQLLEVYRANISALEKSIIGHTKVALEGHSFQCGKYECNLGNLIADSLIYARIKEDQGGAYWTDAPIAFINAGGIRSGIEKRPDGSITENDVIAVLPFASDIFVAKIKGKTLRKALEWCATKRAINKEWWFNGFLQVSGIHVTYDFRNAEGQRVTEVEVRCGECDVPRYAPLDDTKWYNVITTSFLLEGGDEHVFAEDDIKPVRLRMKLSEIFVDYLKNHDYVYPEMEGRINVIEPVVQYSNSAQRYASRSPLWWTLLAFIVRLVLFQLDL